LIEVIISADVSAGVGRSVAAGVAVACTVCAIRISAVCGLVVTESGVVISGTPSTSVTGELVQAGLVGVTLSVDVVPSTVVAMVQTDVALKVSSNVTAGITGEGRRTVAVTLTSASGMPRTVLRHVVARAIGVNSADESA